MYTRSSTAHRTRIFGLILLLTITAMNCAVAQTIRQITPAALASILAQPWATPASGSPNADVTLVEYFDYNCPVCRRIEPQLRKLLANDPGIRVIHKDWPVFGEASVYAAYCSFAAAREGQYAKAHDALIESKQDLDSREDVRKVLQQAGFDLKKIDADISFHQKEYSAALTRNLREATALGLRGTPGLVIDKQLVPGGLDYPQLLRLVAEARNTRSAAKPPG
jgi:protein-disulfide isomerase